MFFWSIAKTSFLGICIPSDPLILVEHTFMVLTFAGINFCNFASLYPQNCIFSATRESSYPRNRTLAVTR